MVPEDINDGDASLGNQSGDKDNIGEGQCAPEEPEETSLGEPSLVLEPDGRPTRERAAPERYNPETGTSYHQKVFCHNIICQEEPVERTLEYSEEESKVVANIIVECNR